MKKVISEVFERYPQVGLPIVKGARNTEEYRDAVLRGLPVKEPADNFMGDDRDSFTRVKTPAGEVEVLYLYIREDFENAVRCLGERCEPAEIPASTGAQMLGGLINWKKIRDREREYRLSGGDRWDEEFERFTSVRENFRDYLILLSSGAYSAVSARRAGETLGREMDEEEWREKSVIIRKYHELTHFICRRLYPENQEAIRDEIVADAVGLIAAFGKYEQGLARLFLGLEKEEYREGGRLENYWGDEDPKQVQTRAGKIIDALAEALAGEHGTEDGALFSLVCRVEESRAGML